MSFNKEKLQQHFYSEYDKLNEQQQKAVDTIEGPVMVIAGPGTGKTQILASRIGKILLDTDAFPENILCLTYTEAGVLAMRRRLLNFIGPDAYKVNIYTFHAFCNDVIQENLSLFEKTAMDPVSDLEKIELFKKLIDAFPKNHPLKRYRGDVYFEIRNLQFLFSTMKREGWTPEFISERIDAYLADLPTRDEFVAKRASSGFKKGDIRTDKIEEQREKMEKLRAAVNEFRNFQQLMRDHNRYDFDDMINWVIRAFEENKNLLSRYQEQYLYMLVDEYQDTSGTQNRLVELLINFWDKPNVFVVGDDDQSIFRFQGANVENMAAFADNYKDDLLTLVLTNNYRSSQPILDISKSLIGYNLERLVEKIPGLSKNLVSSHSRFSDESLNSIPVIKEYETERHEMIDITLQVERLLADNVSPGHIAIIYKENKYGEALTKYFRLRGIPVYSKRSQNILDLPLAKKIVLVLSYLAAEHDMPFSGDEMLFEMLHYNWFGIAPIEVARLSAEVAEKRFSGTPTSIRQLLIDKANQPPKDLFTPGMPDSLRKGSQIIEQLIADVSNLTLQNLFGNIIRDAGVLTAIMRENHKTWEMQVLTGLFDFVKEETRRKPSMTLQQLVTILELMQHEELSIPLIEVSGNDKGVNLLTAHGSKGLEFAYVFLVGSNAGFWEKKRKPGSGYALPDTLFSSLSKQSEEEEYRRLFYVALTRAEHHLQVSYCRFKADGKDHEPSRFIAEIQQEKALPTEKVYIDDSVMLDFQSLNFALLSAPEIEKTDADFIERVLEKFVMNVTALNNYLKCPLEFYFKNLVRIPSPKNEATEFGSAVHYALEQLFRKMSDAALNQSGPGVFPPVEQFVGDFDWYLHRHRESFTREQFERRLEYGHEVLRNYYFKYVGEWNTIVAIERNIRNVVVSGVPIKGKLDKLEFNGKDVNVVDYKTGDPENAQKKIKGPNDKDPDGGDYWRQAVFYKILVDNYGGKDWKVISTEFDFIEPDKKKQFRKQKVVISPADIATVTNQITETWAKIQNRDFFTGCGKEDCHWCEFVKTNNMAVALHELNVGGDENEE